MAKHAVSAQGGAEDPRARYPRPRIIPRTKGTAVMILLAATEAKLASYRDPPATFPMKYIRAVSPEKLPEGMRLFAKMLDRYIKKWSPKEAEISSSSAILFHERALKPTIMRERAKAAKKNGRLIPWRLSATSPRPSLWR